MNVLGSDQSVEQPPSDDRIGRWKTSENEITFHELYARLRDRDWGPSQDDIPQPSEHDVVGSFGTTRVFEWAGPGTPLVLLHGMNATSAMWTPLLRHLAGRHRLVVIDVIGQPNASHQTTPITTVADFSTWLEEITTALGLTGYHLAGASYGAWMAIHTASTTPTRPTSLLLLEPVVDRLRPMFFIHGIAAGLLTSTPGPIRRWAARRFHVGALIDPILAPLGRVAFTKHHHALPKPTPVSDELLHAMKIPTLAVIGTRSAIHKPRAVADRLRASLPHAQVSVLDDAGHALPHDNADRVAPLIEAFLDSVHREQPQSD